MTAGAVSLVTWLRALDDEALATLLHTRRDLATPAPADMSVLATRSGVRASVGRACEDLDEFTLKVLEALVVAEADGRRVPLSEVIALLGTGVPADRVTAAVDRLRALAIAWGSHDGLSVVPAAREVVPGHPGGLGRRNPDLDEQNLQNLLAALSEPERRLLTALSGGSPVGRTRQVESVSGLIRAGLLRRVDEETVELPSQVGIALRGGNPLGQVQCTEPALTTRKVTGVDATAAGEALELLRHVETMIRLWSQDPPSVLRSGGLSVRDLRKLAKDLEITERRATLLVELAVAAGLITDTDESDPEWLPTVAADTWLLAAPEQRWLVLASAWLDLPRAPGLVGGRDERDRPINALSEELRRASAPRERRRVLDLLGSLPADRGAPQAAEIIALLTWRAPRQGGKLRDQVIGWTLEEARELALIGRDALSTAGRELLAGEGASAAKALADALPEPLDHVLVQADLTVVAPGPLEPELAEEITLVADVESAGAATVYRVSESSVRRALDAGRTAAELQELFKTRSRTPVPQSLSYLIDDVARRHGRLRGGAAGSFLRCDDEVLIAEVMAGPMADELLLRRIAPTVLISPLPLAEVLDGLREAGFAPAAEGPDGRVIDLRPGVRRAAKARAVRRPMFPAPPTVEALLAVVDQIRAGDRASGVARGAAVSADKARGGTTATLALLQAAARERRSVWLGFVDSHGTSSQRVVEPVSVAGGVLEGFDQAQGALRRFPLHRITSAALVED
ncbi:DNA-binding protein [Pseudonocardiaceae bacterium YIM PH 21723]|nr:DNA-binding protein [Pseudonocardiaceae bacterium YIM PH 21723]